MQVEWGIAPVGFSKDAVLRHGVHQPEVASNFSVGAASCVFEEVLMGGQGRRIHSRAVEVWKR
jgi:hypothetical protein